MGNILSSGSYLISVVSKIYVSKINKVTTQYNIIIYILLY